MQTPGRSWNKSSKLAAALQRSGVSWLPTGTGDEAYVWASPKDSAPCLNDAAFTQRPQLLTWCCLLWEALPSATGLVHSSQHNSLSLPQTCFSASSYALPTPTKLLRTDFILALSMWRLYSNKNHRNNHANLCSEIAIPTFSVFWHCRQVYHSAGAPSIGILT